MKDQTLGDIFESFSGVLDQLLGPEGCPWDKEQTFASLRPFILEEACEAIEAIDNENDENLEEELGDLLFNIVFLCKLAEKEGRFTTHSMIQKIRDKLVSRHPHVFEGEKVATSEAVLQQWEQIKAKEKSDRKSPLEGIPKGLPALARAYKIIGKLQEREEHSEPLFADEEGLGLLLWTIVRQAKKQKIHPETALRKVMLEYEKEL